MVNAGCDNCTIGDFYSSLGGIMCVGFDNYSQSSFYGGVVEGITGAETKSSKSSNGLLLTTGAAGRLIPLNLGRAKFITSFWLNWFRGTLSFFD